MTLLRNACFLLVFLLAACAPVKTLAPVTSPTLRSGELTPFTPPARITPSAASPSTPTPLPSLTPTPLTHIVREGEDMFGIALQYGLPLDALMTANPTVNPRAMSVGMRLLVPAGERPTPTVANPTPTPLPVRAGAPVCYPRLDSSLMCLVVISNATTTAVENLSGVFRLRMNDGNMLDAPAVPLLNLLSPGNGLPLTVVILPPAPQHFELGFELTSALPVPEPNTRYLDAHIEGLEIGVAPDGLSASVKGEVVMPPAGASAQTVWVGLVALNVQGRPVGVRRWESPQPLPSGQRMAFSAMIYSLGEAIEKVEALVEARP
ncbi:protein containing LysM domain [Anaerolinea thermolimosa]|uniref:LysM peptidoglycan-binding domain-containing protein n=1 Tax=Anaerolinea thermolimosa TaxID=229919 RepID=UPI0007860E9F|nr:LysM domain-containing protein [Anaerolinea thermolimosa]GAP07716.1 protein containing LysM domain [Anaerolinea thermolimosa]